MIDVLKGTVTPRDWAAVGVILLMAVLVVAGGYFFILSKQVEAIGQTEQEIAQVRADLKEAHDIKRNIAKLREEAGQIQRLVDEFESRLPTDAQIALLLAQFEGIANEVGVDVSGKSMARIADPRKETIPYKVSATGTFHEVVLFINRLEGFDRYLKVSELTLKKEDFGLCRAEFVLSTYRFIDDSGRAAS